MRRNPRAPTNREAIKKARWTYATGDIQVCELYVLHFGPSSLAEGVLVSVSERNYLEPLSIGQGWFHPGGKEDGSHSQHRPGNYHQYAMGPDEPLSSGYFSRHLSPCLCNIDSAGECRIGLRPMCSKCRACRSCGKQYTEWINIIKDV